MFLLLMFMAWVIVSLKYVAGLKLVIQSSTHLYNDGETGYGYVECLWRW